MRRIWLAMLAAVVAAGCLGMGRVRTSDGASGIVNGAVWLDTAGNEIWCNGGQTILVDGTWYLVGYDCGPGREWRIRMYSSTDLMQWKFEGNIFEPKPGVPKWKWAGRPGILHNRKTGKFVMLFEAETGEYFRHKVGYATCDRVNGEYKWEHSEYPEPERSTGDQSVYQEGDDAYLLTVLDGPALQQPINLDLAIYKLTPDFLHTERKVFEGFSRFAKGASGHEASHIVKVDGTYYWLFSGLDSWNSTQTCYTTAKSLSGPWSEIRVLRTDPVTGDSYNTQHDFIIPVMGSDSTTYVYAGDRYSQWTGRGTGRNIFLPLVFESGVPVLKWQDKWRIDVKTGKWETVRN